MGLTIEEVDSRSQRKKTVLRTLRVPEDVARALEEAADEDGVSFNALMSSVLTDYTVWARKAKKFGFTFVSKQFFRILLESSDPKKLEALVKERYAGIMKSMAMVWFGDTSASSIIRAFELLAQHNWHMNFNWTQEGLEYTLTFQHDLGEKFSLFLKSMLESTITEDFRSRPTFEEADG